MQAFSGLGYLLKNVLITNTADITIGAPITTSDVRHPRGAVVFSQGTVYFLGAQVRYPFPSAEVFFSWGHAFDKVVPANSHDLAMTVGPVIQAKVLGISIKNPNLQNGMFVKTAKSPTVYRIVDGRYIKPYYSANAFLRDAYSFAVIKIITSNELAYYQLGDF